MTALMASSSACCRWQGGKVGEGFLPHLCHYLADNWQGQLSHVNALGAGLIMPLPPRSVLLCYPGNVQSLFFPVLLLVGGEDDDIPFWGR